MLTEKQWSYLAKRYHLTPRELEVAELVCKGLNDQEIAEELKISRRTVKVHLRNIFGKSQVHNKISMLVRFIEDVNIHLFTEKQWSYLAKRYHLAPRELRAAKFACKGLTRGEIAKKMKIRPDTVKTHLHSIFGKVRVNNKIRMLLRFLGDTDILKKRTRTPYARNE